ncbi:phage portal protein [Halomonas caseinilytica]|uniref:Phage portal protein, HK97 family n=1 Tax=Halomonas caseinilytica TaxID=438744 RepID=A0A1M6UI39_9GAMM|nr:phage portal protein [Halomonas caseinilytica]SHK68837.1 phage portal protein, HK97 family [Halomonas caseinilytica]
MRNLLNRLTGLGAGSGAETREEPTVTPDPSISNETVSSGDVDGMMELFQTAPSYAGPPVTAETAMRVTAVYACVRMLCGAVATMPVHIYRRTETGRERVDHRLWWVLNQEASSMFTAAALWEYLLASMMLRGDGLARIRRNRAGQVTALEPLPRQKTIIEKVDGRLRYYAYLDEEGYVGLDQDDVLHLPNVGFDGVSSPSVIGQAAKQGIGLAMAAEEYSARFFSNGARPDHVITMDGTPTQEQLDRIRNSWLKRHSGAANAHLPGMLVGGAKVHQITMNAEDAQLMEARQFQVTDIARAFGLPGWMINANEKSTSWGSGLEQMGLGFIIYTLQPHLTRCAQEINRKLLRNRQLFAEFNVNALLRGDAKTRAEYYKSALGGTQAPGYMTPNEVRAKENLPPVKGGDQLYSPEVTSNADA